MKTNWITAFGLLAVAVLLFLNVATTFFQPEEARAQSENAIGKYQISAWASPSMGSIQFAGYYVIDTTTGKVVAKHSERLGTGS
jgi:hypothetical protein